MEAELRSLPLPLYSMYDRSLDFILGVSGEDSGVLEPRSHLNRTVLEKV